jgi:predicted permease
MTTQVWLRLYRLVVRTARFDAVDLRTPHAEDTFIRVCEAAAARGRLALARAAIRELAVIVGVIGLAWLGRLRAPRLPTGALSPREFGIATRLLFRSHRGYVALATFVLAVAVGVNVLVFTVVNALWIRPLPYPDADRLVTLPRESTQSLDQPRFRIFDGVAGQVLTTDRQAGLQPRLTVAGIGRELEIIGVTPGYFDLFGLTVRGRDFGPDDDRDGSEPAAIISDRLWAREFGRRPGVIGAVLPAEPFAIRVVGIAPDDFHGARRGENADMWVPAAVVQRLAPADWQDRSLPLMVFGRLGPGQSAATADRRYRDLMRPQDREWLLTYDPTWAATPVVVPLAEVFGTPETRTLIVSEREAALVVAAMAVLVLLGGCATIAALVLVHYERRRAELALKASLGAPRGRLVLELLRDLLLVGAMGSAGGLLVAAAGVRLLPALSLPGGVDLGRLNLSIDWRVCAVGLTATLVTLLGAAARPIARTTRIRLTGELVAGPSSTSLGSQRARQVLLACQVCATIVVLVAAGLFVRAVVHGFRGAPGFDVERTVFVTVQEGNPAGPAERRPDMVPARNERLSQLLRSLPGVDDVAEGVSPIGSNARIVNPLTIALKDRDHQLLFGRIRGGAHLLSVLGVPMLAGRHLTPADASGDPMPAVLTRPLAERLWPDAPAVGQTFSLPQLRGAGQYLVVGVTGDLPFESLARPGSGAVVTAEPIGNAVVASFVIKTDRPDDVVGHVRRAVRGQVVTATTGREIVARDLGRQRLGAWFFSGFGLAALLLGVGGAFGLVAYLAESQRREFGVRLALGADARHLMRLALAAALRPVAAGLAAGLIVATIVSRLFTALLVGISTLDAATYAAATAMMLICTSAAALSAAWRLRHTTPSDALRTR